MPSKKKPSKKKRFPILLCGGPQGRAVIYGDVDVKPVPGEVVTLYDAKMVLYWSKECNGLLGLAANGPKAGTRLTPSVSSVTDTDWKQWMDVSPEASRAFREWK